MAVGLAGYKEYSRGIGLANASQYATAATILDQAVARDPALATNWFQAGYAHAMVALQENDEAHLQQAVESYRKGTALEPTFSINWVNLGVLLWRKGDEQGARHALEQAVERAPQEATFALTLGTFEEARGNQARAIELYSQGLEARPTWADSAFFRATPLRAATRERWLATWTLPIKPLQICWDAFSTGQFDEARHCFSGARTLNDASPYYGLGLTEFAVGNLEQAEWYLRVAVWISDPDPSQAGRLDMALGDVLAQRGDLTGAISHYEQGLKLVNWPGPMGNDAAGVTTSYTLLVFGREAITDHFLPGVVWITVTDDIAQKMLQLGDWYEQVGREEDAARMYRDLLRVAPDMSQAEDRLHSLSANGRR
jgi:tetratricopeptide (TPR) repeat protein